MPIQKRILLMIELVREEICAVVERSQVNWLALKHFGWANDNTGLSETRVSARVRIALIRVLCVTLRFPP